MKSIRHVILISIIPFALNAQGILSLGLGRTFESKIYRHIANIDGAYLHAINAFAIKAGGKFEPATTFNLKYQLFGSIGVTTLLKKNLSGHLLLGIAHDQTTKKQSNADRSVRSNDQVGPMLNLGILYKMNGNIFIGFETYAWGQSYFIGRGSSNEIASSVSISINYRLFFKEEQ